MPIRDEAINVFMNLPGDADARLELTYNFGLDGYDLGTGYGHIAVTADDLDGTLAELAKQGIEPESIPTPSARAARGSASSATRTATGSSSSSARKREEAQGWSQMRRGAQRTLMRLRASSDTPEWIPLRRELGVTGFGINAYVGREVGGETVEPHDETSPGSGKHEEVYLVLSGHALFLVGEQEVDAPEGTFDSCLRVSVARRRPWSIPQPSWCWASRPGAALPVSSFEYWYVAEGPYQRGEYEEAYELASEGLKDYPEHPHLNYQLACYSALAGETDRAIEHCESPHGMSACGAGSWNDDDLGARCWIDPRVRQIACRLRSRQFAKGDTEFRTA